MGIKDWMKRKENWIISLGALAGLMIFTGCRFDYFYDLNDDVLMKDILAGAYTGMPEGHNIQMLWLISALISVFYKIAGSEPWYGIFLCFCHFGCFFAILGRSVSLFQTVRGKLTVAAIESLVFGGMFLDHLVFAQYTVTCTLLAGTAAFLFFTTDMELDGKTFVKRNIPSALLVSIAYLIRSEMLLLVLPMICVAGVVKWGGESRIFTREHAFKYFGVMGMILGGILAGWLTNALAYGTAEWKTFTAFFNNRTELYDFQEIPAYEDHRAFYESIGLTEKEKILLDNYNFGMDEEIDEDMVGRIAEYAGENRSIQKPFWEKLPEKCRDYLYRFTSGRNRAGGDYPWNYMVILGYMAVFLTAIPRKHRGGQIQPKCAQSYGKNSLGAVLSLALLFVVRTGLWMFILMRERAPERITHSLYLMEFLILAAMLLVQWRGICTMSVRKGCAVLVAAGFGLMAALIFPDSLQQVSEKQVQREEVNEIFGELYQYFGEQEHRGNFYLIDVYSSVSYQGIPYSEKMFYHVDNSLDNYDIMGGWACKSPLQRKKFRAFHMETMEQALREREDVYFVCMTGEDWSWLPAYYEDHGTPVEVRLVDTVAGIFEIYAVTGK